ncbi:hypothetical protein BDW74DRAFT_135188 [Aspergillus multicolor]|uniref:uncharacterized protein n=1 Tax=Aspergillus multicolor TaxID=41759 RepID=UPI003CCD13D7
MISDTRAAPEQGFFPRAWSEHRMLISTPSNYPPMVPSPPDRDLSVLCLAGIERDSRSLLLSFLLFFFHLEARLFQCDMAACLFRRSGWSGKAGKGLRVQDASKGRFEVNRSVPEGSFFHGHKGPKCRVWPVQMADPPEVLQATAPSPLSQLHAQSRSVRHCRLLL